MFFKALNINAQEFVPAGGASSSENAQQHNMNSSEVNATNWKTPFGYAGETSQNISHKKDDGISPENNNNISNEWSQVIALEKQPVAVHGWENVVGNASVNKKTSITTEVPARQTSKWNKFELNSDAKNFELNPDALEWAPVYGENNGMKNNKPDSHKKLGKLKKDNTKVSAQLAGERECNSFFLHQF